MEEIDSIMKKNKSLFYYGDFISEGGAGEGGEPCDAIQKLLFILISFVFLMKSQCQFHYERTRGSHKPAERVFLYE